MKRNNREKFDSGIGEEIIEAPNSPNLVYLGSSDSENHMDIESISSEDELDEEERGNKRGSSVVVSGTKWRRVSVSSGRLVSDSSTENETTQDEGKVVQDEMRMISSPYASHMRNKIQELPLPSILKNYLNFYRDF